MKTMIRLAIAAAATFTAVSANAAGLAAKASDLPEAARTKLEQDVAAYKTSHPELFEAVANIQGIKPEFYKQARNPIPLASRDLKRLGKGALIPMLSALVLDAPSLTLSEKEKTAYIVGLLDASAAIKDNRAAPVFKAVFESAGKPAEVQRAAAEALGHVCGDAELATLTKHTAEKDSLRIAAIAGLGECRRVESVNALAKILSSTTDSAVATAVSKALGVVGSSWAWKSMGPKSEETGKAVRETAAKALVAAFAKHKDARAAAKASLRTVEHPSTPTLIANARASATPEVAAELDSLAKAVQSSAK